MIRVSNTAYVNRVSARNWSQHLAEDPQGGQLRLAIAQVARTLASSEEGSAEYNAAAKQDHKLRDQLRALELQRAAH